MKTTHLMMACAVALTASLFTPDSAEAQYLGYGGVGGVGAFGGFGGLYNQSPYLGHPYGSSLYSLGRIPVPPYFSLHPPVYYGRRVRASYGISPFPQAPYYGPQVNQAWQARGIGALPVSTPKVVMNPYFKGDIKPVKRESAPAPKVILNPYYSRDEIKLAQQPRE